jgi:3-methyladenine DNA glycosylase AlkD
VAGPVIVKWIADEADARVQAALGWTLRDLSGPYQTFVHEHDSA